MLLALCSPSCQYIILLNQPIPLNRSTIALAYITKMSSSPKRQVTRYLVVTTAYPITIRMENKIGYLPEYCINNRVQETTTMKFKIFRFWLNTETAAKIITTGR